MASDSSDSDDGFAAVFAGRGKKQIGAKQRSVAPAAATVSSSHQQPQPARPARKVASEARRAELVQTTMAQSRNFARQLALGGVAALRQADVHAANAGDEGGRVAELARRANPAAQAPPPMHASLEEGYAAAMAADKAAAPREESLRAWQRVFALGTLERQLPACGPTRKDDALKAQMTSLARMARVYEAQGQTRRAFNALEELYRLSSLLSRRDRATTQPLVALLRKAAALRSSIGSNEKAAELVLQAAALEAALRPKEAAGVGPAEPADVARDDIAPVEQQQQEKEGAGEEAVSAADASIAAAAVASAEAAADAVTGQGSSPRARAPEPAPAPELPSLADVRELLAVPPGAAADGVDTLFSRAMASAMFSKDFALFRALLNRSLLGDPKARTVLLQRSVPQLKVTPLHVAAASDQADVVRRLLGVVGDRAAVIQHVVRTRDVAGNNAIMHAAACGAQVALDELLKGLFVAGGAPREPVPGSLFAPLGLTQGTATPSASDALPEAYSAPVKQQLAAFCFDPKRYAEEYSISLAGARKEGPAAAGVPAVAPAPAAPVQPPLPPPHATQLIQQQQQSVPHPYMPQGAATTQLHLAAAATATQQMMYVMATSAGIPPALALAMTSGYAFQPPMPLPPGRSFPQAQLRPVPGAPPLPLSAPPPLPPQPSSRPQKSAAAPPDSGSSPAKAPRGVTVRKAAPVPPAAAHVAQNVSLEARDGKLVGRALQPMALPGAAAPSGAAAAAPSSAAAAPPADEMLEELEEGAPAATAAAGSAAGGKKGRRGKGTKGAGGGGSASWDQFAANESLFGVKASSFNEELYTSKLDLAKFTPEQIAAAERLADEMMSAEDQYSSNPHVREERGQAPREGDEEGEEEEGEEERFSAVRRAPRSAAGAGDAFTDAGVAKKMTAKRG